jgi:osmotically-inducible protein OsmY
MVRSISKLILAISILSNVIPCLAEGTESNTEASSEAPGFLTRGTPSDGTLVNTAIQNNNKLSAESKNVNVQNKDGRVVITGTVPTQADKEKLNSAVSQSGAPNISNEVKVQGSSTPATSKQATPKAKLIRVR